MVNLLGALHMQSALTHCAIASAHKLCAYAHVAGATLRIALTLCVGLNALEQPLASMRWNSRANTCTNFTATKINRHMHAILLCGLLRQIRGAIQGYAAADDTAELEALLQRIEDTANAANAPLTASSSRRAGSITSTVLIAEQQQSSDR
jgi:hypothetical protein